MANSDVDLSWDLSEFDSGINFMQTRFQSALLMLAEITSVKMEEYAKDEAIWINRTGNARQGLRGDAYYVTKDQIEIVLSHQVEYGIWLELAHDRNYAILEEAIEENIDQLYSAIKRLIMRVN